MLIRQIKELEADELIKRTEYPVVPPKVDYQLTDLGETLRASLEPLHQWAHTYYETMKDKGIESEWQMD